MTSPPSFLSPTANRIIVYIFGRVLSRFLDNCLTDFEKVQVPEMATQVLHSAFCKLIDVFFSLAPKWGSIGPAVV